MLLCLFLFVCVCLCTMLLVCINVLYEKEDTMIKEIGCVAEEEKSLWRLRG